VPGADYAEEYIEVDDGVYLRVLHWTPRPATAADPVAIPVGIGYVASDTLHGEANIRRMAETLPHARTISFPTNKAMHGADLMPHLDEFLLGLRD